MTPNINFYVVDKWNQIAENVSANLTNNKNSSPHLFHYKIHEIHESKVITYIPTASIGEFYLITDQNLSPVMLAEVIKIEKNHLITLLPLGATTKLSLQYRIESEPVSYKVAVGTHLKGKVLDGFGNILHEFVSSEEVNDDLEDHSEQICLNSELVVPVPFKRKIIDTTFVTGVKGIDLMTPCGVGQRLLVCAQPGVGKTTLINLIAQSARMDIVIINLIGERGREVNEFFDSLEESVKEKSIFIISTADRPNVEKVKSLFTSHIIAAWFRSKGYRVLLLVDSLTRFARALRETSLSNGAIVVRNYTNIVFSVLPQVLEIAGTDEFGSITALYTALFEGESLSNDPLIEEIKSITDGHLVLSRKIANSGRYPAISFLESISRIVSQLATPHHLALIKKIINVYNSYSEFELLIKLGEYETGSNKEIDMVIQQYQQLNNFFSQSVPGNYSTIEDLIKQLESSINLY